MVSKEKIARAFFSCGFVAAPGELNLENNLEIFGDHVQRIPIGEMGYFFYTAPSYVDIAEDKSSLLIKLGHVHDGQQLLTAQQILSKGLVGPGEFKVSGLSGSTSLVWISKSDPKLVIYRNLLSTFQLNYWEKSGCMVVADNLRLMGSLIPWAVLNKAAIPQHFIYRTVYGRQTYLEHVDRLLAGELLEWEEGKLQVKMHTGIRDLVPAAGKQVNGETVAWFTEVMNRVTGIYLHGNEDNAATMLSGGVDSSLIQTAINSQPGVPQPFPTVSFSVDNPSFAYEVEYARQAAQQLGTRHEFVKLDGSDYRDNLVQAIQLLGQPLPDDVRPCFLALTTEIAQRWPAWKTIFHGQIADGLHGVSSSLAVVQGDKYHSWPPVVLELLGKLLLPISQSKSYGASQAAQILRGQKDLKSPEQFLNAVGLYTNWDSVVSSFSPDEINQAFTMKRVLGYHYLDSNLLVEQLNVLDLVTDGIDPACVVNQFGLFHGHQFVFPYSDQSLVEATFSFEPTARYTHGHRVKPILKTALENQQPRSVTSQPKGWSGMGEDTLFGWMRDGELTDLVHDITRPGFMKQAEFDQKIEQPDWFTWNLLTLDIFEKQVLGDN